MRTFKMMRALDEVESALAVAKEEIEVVANKWAVCSRAFLNVEYPDFSVLDANLTRLEETIDVLRRSM